MTHNTPILDVTGEWAIFSAGEARTGNERGYWNKAQGWVDQENATRYTFDHVGAYGLPHSLHQDRTWINLTLAQITTGNDLTNALEAFCAASGLPQRSADDLLYDDELALHPTQKLWLTQFIEQWDSVIY